MGVMFYQLDHLLMREASITGNREVKVNQAFFSCLLRRGSNASESVFIVPREPQLRVFGSML